MNQVQKLSREELDELDYFGDIYDSSSIALNKDKKDILKNKEDYKKEIGMILLLYKINNDQLDIDKISKVKEIFSLDKFVSDSFIKMTNNQSSNIEKILSDSYRLIYERYGYKVDRYEMSSIVQAVRYGKTLDERLISHNAEIMSKLKKDMIDFIEGKISINDINNLIDKRFNEYSYRLDRLVENEIHEKDVEVFRKYAEEQGATLIKRSAVLDSKTCDKCIELDGKTWVVGTAEGDFWHTHVKCRCHFFVVEK